MKKNYRSPLFYVGDKYKLLPEILQYFPKKIHKFAEPFTGGGSVFLNIEANLYCLNDIDQNIKDLHEFLTKSANNSDRFFKSVENTIRKYELSRSYLEEIVPLAMRKKWKKTYYAHFNRTGYQIMKTDYNAQPIPERNPLLLYLLLIYGFNRMTRFNREGKFNIPVGNVDFNKNVKNSLEDYFRLIRNRRINWTTLDFIDFLEKTPLGPKDFVYLDPPYLITASEYNKFWNEEREKELIGELRKLDQKNIKFAISNVVKYRGRENKLFENWMKNYNVHRVRSNYISYHDNTSKKPSEVLVTNY